MGARSDQRRDAEVAAAPAAPIRHDAPGDDDAPAREEAPLRVAFVLTRSDSVGGASVHVRDLARWLRGRGDDAHVVVGGTGPFTDLLADAGVPFTSLPALQRDIRPAHDLRAAAQLLGVLRRVRPDVLSLHTAKAGALGRLVAPLLRRRPRTLYTPHGWAFTSGVPDGEARRYRRLERWLARWPGDIVNVCAFERSVALAARVGRVDQHLVVHNGMPERPDLPLATPESAAEPPHLVMVARFEPQKDHGTLLRALALLGPDAAWRLSLVGDGPLRAATEALARELGLGARVRFLGALDDVAPTLATAQLFVLTTRWEGFPRSVLEAMRAGLPVIASRAGGVHEAIEDGVSGLLTDRGDVAGLADALRRLLGRPDLRAAMGAAGRSRYLRDFTFERMASAMSEIYRRR